MDVINDKELNTFSFIWYVYLRRIKTRDLFWIKNYISLNGGEKPSFRREPTLKNTFKAQVAVVFA